MNKLLQWWDRRRVQAAWADACRDLRLRIDEGTIVYEGLLLEARVEACALRLRLTGASLPTEVGFGTPADDGLAPFAAHGWMHGLVVAPRGAPRFWHGNLGPRLKSHLEILCGSHEGALRGGELTCSVFVTAASRSDVTAAVRTLLEVAKAMSTPTTDPVFLLAPAFTADTLEERAEALRYCLRHIPQDPQFKDKLAALKQRTDPSSRIDVALAFRQREPLAAVLAEADARTLSLTIAAVHKLEPDVRYRVSQEVFQRMEDTMTLAIERVLPGGPDTLAPDSASIAAHWQRCYDSIDTDSELLATYRDAAMVVAASIF